MLDSMGALDGTEALFRDPMMYVGSESGLTDSPLFSDTCVSLFSTPHLLNLLLSSSNLTAYGAHRSSAQLSPLSHCSLDSSTYPQPQELSLFIYRGHLMDAVVPQSNCLYMGVLS